MNTLTNFASGDGAIHLSHATGVLQRRDPLANNLAAVIEGSPPTHRVGAQVVGEHQECSVIPADRPEPQPIPLDPGWPSVSLVPRSTFNNGEMICV